MTAAAVLAFMTARPGRSRVNAGRCRNQPARATMLMAPASSAAKLTSLLSRGAGYSGGAARARLLGDGTRSVMAGIVACRCPQVLTGLFKPDDGLPPATHRKMAVGAGIFVAQVGVRACSTE